MSEDTKVSRIVNTNPGLDSRLPLERAIAQLEALLSEHPNEEPPYQKLFEEHPVILFCLGFDGFLPRPRLPIRAELRLGQYYEPDFLAVNTQRALVEIIDLKTPSAIIANSRTRRNTLRADFNSYIEQVNEYRDYFAEYDHRNYINETFGLTVTAESPTLIIGSRDAETDKTEVHRLLARLESPPRILTYDDVLEELIRRHSVASESGISLPGATFLANVTFAPQPSGTRRFVMDAVFLNAESRWSIFMDEHGDLVFQLVDNQGRSHIVRAPSGTEALTQGTSMLLACEFSSSEQRSFMRIRINDRIVAETTSIGRLVLGMEIPSLYEGRLWVGTDCHAQNHGNLQIGNVGFHDAAMDFRSRIDFINSLLPGVNDV